MVDKHKYTILIVDDEPEILASLERALRLKYQVLTINQSTEVIDFLKENKVDMILMDIRMPGITGTDLLKEVKFIYPHMPVFIMTGHGNESDAVTCLKYGASGYIKKPINLYDLFDDIKKILSDTADKGKSPVKILLVDDDDELLKSLKRNLLLHSYNVTECSSSKKALELLQNKDFELLITDEKMPGLSGLALIAQAKEYNANLVAIMMTGVSNQDIAIQSIKAGAFDYIKKPFETSELISSIERSIYKLEINREIQSRNRLLAAKSEALERLNNEIIIQKNYLKNIVESISNILIITDASGTIKMINEFASEKLEYKSSEICGKRLDAIYPVKNISELIAEISEKNNIFNIESEYLTKNNKKIPVIISASLIRGEKSEVNCLIFVAQDISERKKNEEKLYQLSYYDSLTNLPNRLYFEMQAKQLMTKAIENGKKIAFLMMDIDGFKTVNDRLGHAAGDELLVKFASRLSSSFRSSDFIARLAGDEFIACVTPIDEKIDVGIICQRLINYVNQPIYLEDGEVCIGLSIGVAFFPDSAENYSDILKYSDIALYKAKQNGRNQFQYFNRNINNEFGIQLEIENALRFAIEREELYLEYQPIYNLATGKLKSFEALLRWNAEKIGVISPDVFIPIAELNGLILPISDWVMRNAIAQLAKWVEAGHTDFAVNINISARQLDRGDYLCEILSDLCREYNVLPSMVELELTETAIMYNTEQAEYTLSKLHDLGFVIVVDDFGKGFSSLSLLSKLPFSILKIDKQFVQGVISDKNKFIIKSIISLSKGLAFKVVGEGIETEEQLDYLKSCGCQYGQGFYFAKPKNPEDIAF